MTNLVSPCPTCGTNRLAQTTNPHETIWRCTTCGISREET